MTHATEPRTHRRPGGAWLLRRWVASADPADIQKVLVEITQDVTAHTDGRTVLLRRDGGPWTRDTSIPAPTRTS
ncbi:hypothetical protein [Streptomyces sp. NPDC090036]|uniref:hypothetical protein n=1 Tax=Streptomyces sp. NPDC090036 TaxID=3365926 RepID=UPI00382402E6